MKQKTITKQKPKLDIKQIVSLSGMSTRPAFYSGRGAIRTDLNGKILKEIHNGIDVNFGAEAAEAFVKMVKGMKQLSATAFLNELYALASNNFVFTTVAGFDTFEIANDNDGNYDVHQGMVSVMSALGNSRDETESIKNEFLWMIGERNEQPRWITDGRTRRYA